MIFDGLLNEFENLVRNLLLSVEESLLLIVLPVESEVENTNRFPKIAQLSTSSIDYTGDLVGNNEF